MDFSNALHYTEILLAIALLQQSLEHIFGPRKELKLFLPKALLCILLAFGFYIKWVLALLLIHSVYLLKYFKGPYNGGSDRMSLLITTCLSLIYFTNNFNIQKLVFGYLALQLVLSYFIPGLVKAFNREWWTGQVLKDVFEFSSFPASNQVRKIIHYPKLLCMASCLIILFELAFPIVFINQDILMIGLCLALSFHIANSYLFGFNRFIWAWLAAYPSLIWLHNYL